MLPIFQNFKLFSEIHLHYASGLSFHKYEPSVCFVDFWGPLTPIFKSAGHEINESHLFLVEVQLNENNLKKHMC